jgi:hypothetical protein
MANMMTWQEVNEVVRKELDGESFPEGIHPNHKELYTYLEVEVRFNEIHGINKGYTENMRNHKHQIIGYYLDTKFD